MIILNNLIILKTLIILVALIDMLVYPILVTFALNDEGTPIILFQIHPQSGMSDMKQIISIQKKNENRYSVLAMEEITISTM